MSVKPNATFQFSICEHLGISHLTEKRVKIRRQTGVSDHLLAAGHDANLDDFKIISRDLNRCDLTLCIKESLLIKRMNPTLNRANSSLPLELFD